MREDAAERAAIGEFWNCRKLCRRWKFISGVSFLMDAGVPRSAVFVHLINLKKKKSHCEKKKCGNYKRDFYLKLVRVYLKC